MKKIISLMLALVMIASVCVLPVSASTVAFEKSNVKVTDAAEGIISVSGKLLDAPKENRYVTILVVGNGVKVDDTYEYMLENRTLALTTAVADLNGEFYSSFKFDEPSSLYDFYVLYETEIKGPVMFNFISLADTAAFIRSIATGGVSKDNLVSQIKTYYNGLGLDVDARFPVGFDRDLFVYRLDKARKELDTSNDNKNVLASFGKLVEKIEDEVVFVKAVNAVTYKGDYMALLDNDANVRHTGIDFTKYNSLDASLKDKVVATLLTYRGTFKNGDEIKVAFDSAVSSASSQGGNNGGGPVGGGGGGVVIKPVENDREIATEMEDNSKVKFTDIASVAWAKEAIENLAAKGIIAGTSNGIFEPNGLVTREQFAKLIVLASGKYNPNAVNQFTDIPAGDWSASYVASAKAAGFINGVGEGKFGYGASITREDMAVMIYNVMKALGTNFGDVNKNFADYDQISDYAKEAVGALTAKGIINGVGDNMFAPKATATRAQAALLVYAITKGVA